MTETVVNQQSHFRYSFVIFILFSPRMFMQHHCFDFTDAESRENWKAAASMAGKERSTRRPSAETQRFQAEEAAVAAVAAVTGIHLIL